MTQLPDIDALVVDYANEQVALATAPLTAQLSAATLAASAAQSALAAVTATEQLDEQQIVALKAQITALLNPPPAYPYPIKPYAPAPGETVPHFIQSPTTLEGIDFGGVAAVVSDFAQGFWNHNPHDVGGWGLLGNYVGAFLNAKLSMKPMSSTKAALVNALTKGDTTNFEAFRLGRGANPNVPVPSFFTGRADGTDQGHPYTLMQSYETVGSKFGPFILKGARGEAGGQPPWETFAWGSFHDIDPTWTDFEIDGTDENGKPVSASGIGAGPQDKGGTYNYIRGFIHDLAFGGAITHYSVTNTVLNFIDMHFKNIPAAAINLEKANGSTVNVIRPTFENTAVDLVVDSDQGFATVLIQDPVLTAAHPKVVVCNHAKYDYPGPPVDLNKQLDAASNNHTTLIVDGKTRPELLQIVDHYTVNGKTF